MSSPPFITDRNPIFPGWLPPGKLTIPQGDHSILDLGSPITLENAIKFLKGKIDYNIGYDFTWEQSIPSAEFTANLEDNPQAPFWVTSTGNRCLILACAKGMLPVIEARESSSASSSIPSDTSNEGTWVSSEHTGHFEVGRYFSFETSGGYGSYSGLFYDGNRLKLLSVSTVYLELSTIPKADTSGFFPSGETISPTLTTTGFIVTGDPSAWAALLGPETWVDPSNYTSAAIGDIYGAPVYALYQPTFSFDSAPGATITFKITGSVATHG